MIERADSAGLEDLAAVLAFLREGAVAHASRVEELPFGVACLVPELPDVWDFNAVWVDRPVAAAELLGALDRLAAEVGLRHGEALVPDPALAAELAPALEAAGYERTTLAVLVQRRAPDRPAAHPVEEVGLAAAQAVTRASLERDPSAFSPAVVDQLCEAKAVSVRAGATCLGVRAAGEVVSVCDLYLRGELAQIESLITLEAHRNRGLARSLVLGAADRARAAGAPRVFLLAEADDWPIRLYERLGFDRAGELVQLLRPGAPRRAGAYGRSSCSAAELMQ